MSRRFRSRGALAGMLVVVLVASVALAWSPPPPRFADTSPHSPVDLPIAKWEPSLGEPTSLLDVLPAGSPAAADYTGNGFLDFFIPVPGYTDPLFNEIRDVRSRLYMNDQSRFSAENGVRGSMQGLSGGEERFIDATDLAGINVAGNAYSAAWGDLDGDRRVDLFVGGYRLARLFHNQGDGTFADVTAAAGIPQDGFVLGAAWGDYDGDGHLDLLLVQFAQYTHPEDGLPDFSDLPGLANTLLRNNGDGTFTDVTAEAGLAQLAGRSTSGVFVDANGNGRLDIFVTNWAEPVELWLNNGDGTFTESAAAAGLDFAGEATCQAWEDINHNGRLDVFIGNHGGRSALFIGEGSGSYHDASDTPGLEHTDVGEVWGCAVFDYDNDNDFDIFLARSGLQGDMKRHGMLLMNTVDGNCPDWEAHVLSFMDVTLLSGTRDRDGFKHLDTFAQQYAASGVTAFDWFSNGHANIMITTNDDDRVRFFRNHGWFGWLDAGHGFRVVLEGTESNALGLGAKVTAWAGNYEVTRQAGTSMSWGGQSITPIHFGFPFHHNWGPRPLSVKVEWPSGQVDLHENLFRMDTMVRLIEGGDFSQDVMPPQPRIANQDAVAGKNTWYVSEQVTLHLSAREYPQFEASGMKAMRVSTDGETWQTVPDPALGTTRAFAGDGTHPLWIETEDNAGNRALLVYPVRIDTEPPAGRILDPLPGALYVQNQQVGLLTDGDLDRAIVVAPRATPAWPAEGDPPTGGVFGTRSAFPVRTEADDATSGVWKVSYRIIKSNDFVPDHHVGTARLAPYTWWWTVNETVAGEWRLETTVTDFAGHSVTFAHRVVVVPTEADALVATVQQGPSYPCLSVPC